MFGGKNASAAEFLTASPPPCMGCDIAVATKEEVEMLVEEQVANTPQCKVCDLVKRKKLIPEGLFCFVKLKHRKSAEQKQGFFPC